MNTLTIPQIFANFSFYKENYLSIINNADQYYVPVKGAEVQIWPLTAHQLFLGDLLQLWFAGKWTVDNKRKLLINTILRDKTLDQTEQDLFVYEIKGSSISGEDSSTAWSRSEDKAVDISVGSIFQFYCVFKGLSRPIQTFNSAEKLKSAI